MRELLTSKRLAAPHFRYTPCVRSGAFGFVSGMVALDPATGALVDGGVAEQTQRIFDNLMLALPDYGFSLEQLCAARVYTTRFDRFADFNEVWERQFARIDPPARTAVGVSALPLGALVEIEFCFHQAGTALS
ncbi:MAG: RidA family protein [Burkholderiales bacterium]|nr:RidA family protein [Burkholderiales bacterium]MDE1925583.1 RidA family protein [Burkholderiales bacterium]MDE2159091.1 RidA family protein [Burkholderiales bacterium]MDE2503256.1 RidA family protein [Burkholderiales bacterium]